SGRLSAREPRFVRTGVPCNGLEVRHLWQAPAGGEQGEPRQQQVQDPVPAQSAEPAGHAGRADAAHPGLHPLHQGGQGHQGGLSAPTGTCRSLRRPILSLRRAASSLRCSTYHEVCLPGSLLGCAVSLRSRRPHRARHPPVGALGRAAPGAPVRIALLFIDGVGVGEPNPAFNPLARGEFLLSQFSDGSGTPLLGGSRRLLETTFGVPGRPQSATNQTALLTGEPAPRILGRHVLGYPNPALREILFRSSVVKRLRAAGRTATFVNGYPAGYLQALGLPHPEGEAPEVVIPARARHRLKASSTTLAFAAGQVPLRTLGQLRAGKALAHDVTGSRGRARGLDI